MCSVVGTRRTELECSVLEEDWQRGQSYMAHWHSLTLVPQPQHRLHVYEQIRRKRRQWWLGEAAAKPTVMEAELSAKHWEARRLLQRFLSGAISKNYPHPKTCSARRPHQPTSDNSAMKGPKLQRDRVHIQKEICGGTMRPKSAVFETSERKTVVKITKLPRFLG